jgi:spermidine synthase
MGRLALLTVFALSGAAGLLYEVVWTRQLSLLLGVTAASVSTVLAVFMAGLGIGSAFAHRLLGSREAGGRGPGGRNPILFYAACEFGIGAWGALTPWLLGLCAPIYVGLRPALGDGVGLTLARSAIAGVVLLPATILMGATLPALARAATASGSRAGAGIGALYAINTLGAVAGTLAAAFFTIEWLGMRGTIALAAAINGLVGIAAAAISFRWRSVAAPGGAAPAAPGAEPEPFPDSWRGTALRVTCLSGLAALACEGLWTRYLVYAVGDNSAYAFAEMLAVFLLGLAAGSATMAPLADRFRNPMAALAALQALLAAACVASAGALDSPGRGGGLGGGYSGHEGASWGSFLVHGLLASGKVVFVPTLLFGATFPLVARIVTRAPATSDRDVGRALAWNTSGAIAGALLSGFVILPTLGFAKGMVAVGLVNLAAAAHARGAAARAPGFGWRARRILVLGSVAAVALFLGSTAFAIARDGAAARALTRNSTRDKLVFYEDGPVSSVGITEDTKTGFRLLYVGGDAQASTDPEGMIHLRLLGHLPALLHPNPKSGLVICFGAGVTLGSLASHPFETLEVCELSPSVLRANRAGFFDDGNRGVIHDPRLRITLDDGRNHLLATDRTYDVITTDPIDPDDAGVTSLYSKEFYELEAKRLNPGGVACQWITTQYSLEVLKSLIESFRQVFPDCFLVDAAFTTVLVGRKPGGAPIPFERLERAFRDPRVAASLGDVGIDGPNDLLALVLAGPRELEDFCRGAAPNTDDRPIAEVVAPRSEYGNDADWWLRKERVLQSMRGLDRSRWIADWTPQKEEALRPTFDAIQRAMASRLFSRMKWEDRVAGARAVLESLAPPAPRINDLMAAFDRCDLRRGESDPEFESAIEAGIGALTNKNADGVAPLDARANFEAALARRPASCRALLGLAVASAQAGDPAAAIDRAAELLRWARYADDYLGPFCEAQMDVLVGWADEPERGPAARAALTRLTDAKISYAPSAWADWWQSQRRRVRLDGEMGRYVARGEPGGP